MSAISYILPRQPYTEAGQPESATYLVHPSERFYILLGVAQELQVDFLPIIHQTALGEVANTPTSDIFQTFINPKFSLAVKRIQHFPTALNEIVVYGHWELRSHKNVLRLEGISWEVSETGDVSPNLVFEKSALGNCEAFFNSDEGQQIPMDGKIDMCLQLAKAVALIHRADIIHGDIKPQNILIFPDGDSKYLAKLSDFGYSSYVPHIERDRLVFMPKSIPWNAPEHHYRGFKFDDAVKMDIFSFGVFCLWLLFTGARSDQPFKVQGPSNDASVDLVLEQARRFLESERGLHPQTKSRLGRLFDLSVSRYPERRSSCMDEIVCVLEPKGYITRLSYFQLYLKH